MGESEKKKSSRGGARAGAGRKKGSGAFGEQTVPMRVPVSLAPHVEKALMDLRERATAEKELGQSARRMRETEIRLPVLGGAAFPKEEALGPFFDLGKEAIPNAASSYAVRANIAVGGNDWADHGIFDGDWAIVDRSASLSCGDLVAAGIDGAARLSRLSEAEGGWAIHDSDGNRIASADRAESLGVWGKVVSILRRMG